MNKLIFGFIFIALGVVILIFYGTIKRRFESIALQIPYLKHGAIAFILFGTYYLVRFMMNR